MGPPKISVPNIFIPPVPSAFQPVPLASLSLWPPVPSAPLSLLAPSSLQPSCGASSLWSPCPCGPLVPSAPMSLWPPVPLSPPPPPASATPWMYVWMSKEEFSCLWIFVVSTKPLWSRGMISARQARGPGFDPPLRKVFQLSDFYFCWGYTNRLSVSSIIKHLISILLRNHFPTAHNDL